MQTRRHLCGAAIAVVGALAGLSATTKADVPDRTAPRDLTRAEVDQLLASIKESLWDDLTPYLFEPLTEETRVAALATTTETIVNRYASSLNDAAIIATICDDRLWVDVSVKPRGYHWYYIPVRLH